MLADQLDAGSGDLFILEVEEVGVGVGDRGVGVGVGDRGGGVRYENLLFLS